METYGFARSIVKKSALGPRGAPQPLKNLRKINESGPAGDAPRWTPSLRVVYFAAFWRRRPQFSGCPSHSSGVRPPQFGGVPPMRGSPLNLGSRTTEGFRAILGPFPMWPFQAHSRSAFRHSGPIPGPRCSVSLWNRSRPERALVDHGALLI